MGRVGKKRKRYILFDLDSTATPEIREEFTRLLSRRYPALKSAVVWLNDGVIVRSDNSSFKSMREEVAELKVGDFNLKPRLSSGSISKLKRLVKGQAG